MPYVWLCSLERGESAYFSADSVLEDNHKDALPVNFLNSLTLSGAPDHEMKMKVGAPIMLLRNLQTGRDQTLKKCHRDGGGADDGQSN